MYTNAGSERRHREQAPIGRRRFIFLTGSALGAVAISACSPRDDPTFESNPDWEHQFVHDPDGSIDFTKWSVEDGRTIPDYNHEVACYTSRTENIRVQNGELILQARREWREGLPYTSAYISTKGKCDFRYGRIEAEIKIPAGAGTWPAVWMLPSSPRYHARELGLGEDAGDWPLNGEIDIVESIGARPNTVFANAHTYSTRTKSGVADTAQPRDVPALSNEFHRFAVEWLPESLTFLIDGAAYHSIKKKSDHPVDWPFDQPYYLIINLAMGGTWGGEKYKEYPPDGVDPRHSSWQLAVRSVRHYSMIAK